MLILSTWVSSSVPVITNAAGDVDRDFHFSIDGNAKVFQTCSLTWQNEQYIFGGSRDYKQQILKVNSCKLELVGALSFDHIEGGCVNVANNQIYMCFNNHIGDYRQCRVGSSPLGQFKVIPPSRVDHQAAKIATNNGEWNNFDKSNFILDVIIAVGSFFEHNKAELLSVNGHKWTDIDDYPFSSDIVHSPVVHLSGSFYLFGGYALTNSYQSTIGRFDMTTQKWSRAGNLVTARSGHSVIFDGQFLLVVGGDPGKSEAIMTEKCAISNGQWACVSQTPELTKYSDYPELFLIPAGFCKEMP